MYKKIKEMQYGSRTTEVIARGQSNINSDVKFIVINCRGSHMCAYVTFPSIDKVDDYDDFYVDTADVHGGFTYLGKVPCANDDVKYIGWDYAHLGDFTCSGIPGIDLPHLASGERKWTVDEVCQEAEKVANAIAYEMDAESDEEDKDDDYILNVMVSLPCHGRTDEELDAIVDRLNDDYNVKEQIIQLFQDDSGDCYYVPSDVAFVRNHPLDIRECQETVLGAVSNERLYYLGMAIGIMSAVDAVYFVDGWESAKGCCVEKLVCDLYDIPHIIERKED